MPPLGFWEIIIILAIVLLLFGGKKIPQLARDLGTGFREFKKTMSDAEKEVTDIRHEIEDTRPRSTTSEKSAGKTPVKKKKVQKT
jgi:sec-independent protein translocase protein TatA